MTKIVRTSKRICRYCSGEYRVPVGQRYDGCPQCAPTLLDLEPEPISCSCARLIPDSTNPPIHEPTCSLYDGIPF